KHMFLLFLEVLAMEMMLIGKKYYERVTQPIVTKERWEQYLKLINDSIVNDYSLRFTTYRGIANISEILYVKERLKYARFYATS
ncbi:hypothetical protein AF286_15410, partial [Listeria monocytogenes]|nr:hypothetical protein [Listeria monocytogenes]